MPSETLTSKEVNAVLAGLRLLQENIDSLPDDIEMIASDDETQGSISEHEIDDLAERINCADELSVHSA